MKLKPLFDRVIAIPIENQNTTESGISLGESIEAEVKKAKVISVGSGCYDSGVFVDMVINIDDIIYYEEHTVAHLYDGAKEYILIKQYDILAKE